jgi:predicted nuclease with TOPRIM domain
MDPTIIAAIIATAPGAATLVLTRRQRRHAAATLAQVQNSHKTNLRDDVDRVLDKLDEVAAKTDTLIQGQTRHDAEISGLRADMRVERQERLALAERLKENHE